jgi:hypothetical protein
LKTLADQHGGSVLREVSDEKAAGGRSDRPAYNACAHPRLLNFDANARRRAAPPSLLLYSIVPLPNDLFRVSQISSIP